MSLEPKPGAAEALLLIDLQVDFLSANGRLPIDQGQVDALLQTSRRAVEEARANGWPIVAIVNEFGRWDPLNVFRNFASLKGSAGAAWDPRAPQERDALFAKNQPDSFSNPGLGLWLAERGIKRVRLLGVKAGACVTATAKSALKRGLEVVLLGQGIGCNSEGSRRRALGKLERVGARVV